MDKRKNFIRQTEDFTCERCGCVVRGTGYTNHCPQCLTSKHVDNLPGDRANSCGGLMPAIGIEIRGEDYDLIHRCERCGITKRNKVADNDDRAAIINILHSSS